MVYFYEYGSQITARSLKHEVFQIYYSGFTRTEYVVSSDAGSENPLEATPCAL